MSNNSGGWANTGVMPVRKSAYKKGKINNPYIRPLYKDIQFMQVPYRSLFVEESLAPVIDSLIAILSGNKTIDDIKEATKKCTILLNQERD